MDKKCHSLWVVILWTITAMMSAFGFLILCFSYYANSYDVAAVFSDRGIAFAVIPYVFTRSIAEIKKS